MADSKRKRDQWVGSFKKRKKPKKQEAPKVERGWSLLPWEMAELILHFATNISPQRRKEDRRAGVAVKWWGGRNYKAEEEESFIFLLSWMRGHGCQWDSSTCSSAAKGGHLEVLKWARARGCPWTEATCANAAGGGHLEVLM